MIGSIVLIIFSIGFYFYDKAANNNIQLLLGELNKCKSFEKSIKRVNEILPSTNNTFVPQETLLYQTEGSLEVMKKMKDIFIANYTFCIVFPNDACKECYDDVFIDIDKISKILNGKVVIIVPISQYIFIKNIMKYKGKNLNLFYYKDENSPIAKGPNHAPFFFVIDSHYYRNHVFIPIVNHHDMTKVYYTKIIQRYF